MVHFAGNFMQGVKKNLNTHHPRCRGVYLLGDYKFTVIGTIGYKIAVMPVLVFYFFAVVHTVIWHCLLHHSQTKHIAPAQNSAFS